MKSGLEIAQDLPDVDTVLVPVGGGGLSAGVATANKLGMDGEKLLAMQDTPQIMQAWKDSEVEAAQRGIFGTPTWIYQDILYWGQDRLDFLDEALSR